MCFYSLNCGGCLEILNNNEIYQFDQNSVMILTNFNIGLNMRVNAQSDVQGYKQTEKPTTTKRKPAKTHHHHNKITNASCI